MTGVGDNLPAAVALLEKVDAAIVEGLVFSVDERRHRREVSYRRRVWRAREAIRPVDGSWSVGRVRAVLVGSQYCGIDRRRLVLVSGRAEALVVVRYEARHRRPVAAIRRVAPCAI